jgi:hypothetical protein
MNKIVPDGAYDEPLDDETLSLFRKWAADPPESVPLLDRSLVHKYQPANVFVARMERVLGTGGDRFATQFAFDPAHAFFFEHPLDHVPALMLMEAGRQAATAALHLFYDVPVDAVVIVRDIAADFASFAELDRPVFGASEVAEPQIKAGKLTGMFLKGWFVQDDRRIGVMIGSWLVLDRRVAERMRDVWKTAGTAGGT